MIDLGLVIARFLHYVATTTLAGVSLFPLYAYAGGVDRWWWKIGGERCFS